MVQHGILTKKPFRMVDNLNFLLENGKRKVFRIKSNGEKINWKIFQFFEPPHPPSWKCMQVTAFNQSIDPHSTDYEAVLLICLMRVHSILHRYWQEWLTWNGKIKKCIQIHQLLPNVWTFHPLFLAISLIWNFQIIFIINISPEISVNFISYSRHPFFVL